VLIREATLDDVPGVARIHVDTWRTAYRGLMPAAFLSGLSYADRERIWAQNLSNSARRSFLLVAEAPTGLIVGFACGGPERTRRIDYRGELYALYVLEMFQRQGLGRALMRATATAMLEGGLESMLIWVLADNRPARRFYESMGGILVGEQPIEIGGARLVEVAYGWGDLRPLASP
jgi:ribosomal protein S18 acetylase RimI-like enzyme